MAKQSVLRTLVDRSRRLGRIEAWLATTDELLREGLCALSPDPEEGESGYRFLRLQLRRTRAALEALLDNGRQLARERGDDDAAQRRKQEATVRLYDNLKGVRVLVLDTWGRQHLNELGLVGTLPRRPVKLTLVGRLAAEGLRQLTFPPPRRRGVSVDPVALADSIEEDVAAVEATLDAWAAEEQQLHQAVYLKNEALAHFDLQLRALRRLAATDFELIGRPDLAEEVLEASRPGHRRRGARHAPDAPAPARDDDDGPGPFRDGDDLPAPLPDGDAA